MALVQNEEIRNPEIRKVTRLYCSGTKENPEDFLTKLFF